MALLKWGYDDEEEKKDETLGATPVQSVQSSWQPASSNASVTGQSANIFDQNTGQDDNNYLMSTQKSQIDQQLEARKAAEEAARQEANRQAEIARQSTVTYTEPAQQTVETPAQTPEVAAKNDTGWKKYYGDEFKKEQAGLDFFGRLLDNGQAARRAETNARTKYNSEVLNQAYDDDGNTISQAAADKARILANENSNIANENSARGLAISRAIGATKDTQPQNFFDKVRQTVNAEKNMSIYDAIFGADDTQNFGIDDAGRFVGGLVQGIGTMPTIGAKELYEMGVGRGTDAATGTEKDLNLAERAGRGVSGALNVATSFMGGSGKLLESLTTKAAKGTITDAEQSILTQLANKILFPATEQGGIEAAQTGAEYFGEGGNLVDENGNIDQAKLLEFAKQTGTAGAMGFGGGALMAGAGAGIKRLRDGKIPEGGDLTPIGGQKDINLPERPSQPVNTNLELTPLLDAPNINQIADSTIPNATLEPSQGSQFQPIADRLPIIGRENIPTTAINTRDKVGITETDNYDTSLQKLDTALENGAITNDEHSQLENELFTSAEQRGEAIAETGAETPEEAPKPVSKPKGDVVPTVAQNIPLVKSEQVRQLQESKAGKSQAEEADINQKLQQSSNATPAVDSVPDGMGGVTPVKTTKPKPELSPEQQNSKLFAERMMKSSGKPDGVKQRLADSLGLSKDSASDIDTLLQDGGVKPKQAEKIKSLYSELETIHKRNIKYQKENRKNYTSGVPINESINMARNADTRRAGLVERKLQAEIDQLLRKGDIGERLTQGVENVVRGRAANMLASTGNVTRNLPQEIGANVIAAIKNPIKSLRGTVSHGNLLKDAAKGSLQDWTVLPKTPTEGYKYLIGNTYKTAMTPVTAAANARKGALRTELTRWAAKEIEGKNLSNSQAEKLSRTLGNYSEALVNTLAGVDNGMVSSPHAMKTLKAWKEFVKSGDAADLTKFESLVERQSSLANKMLQGVFEGRTKGGRVVNSMVSAVFPFVRTAWNTGVTGATRTLNPLSKSLIDDIRADQRGAAKNIGLILKNKIVDYGILTGAAILVGDGLVGYNDGEEVDKPQGVYIKVGDNTYIPVRATPLELPLAVTVAASLIAKDVAAGEPRDPSYYGKIISRSLPYIDAFEQNTGAIESLANIGGKEGDKGYAAKSYGVNLAKSLVPFSNNGVLPFAKAVKGESLNAKSVYDKDMGKWLSNAVKKGYMNEAEYNKLIDSRDAAGRVRTVDNQGVIINKKINDANTATYNDTIDNLVDYGRKNELGKNTQDMFNTYDTGKNNNFKSTQDAITFLDVPDGGKPDNTKKLEKNDKLSNLSQQIRDGFYGDTGSELLTLDGKELKSDASVPSTSGAKNSKLPLSMQSIKNAVAQTDLGKDDSDKLYAISGQKTELYNQLKAKSITYDQYSAAKSELEKGEIGILSNSKSYKKLGSLMDKLDQSGFFAAGGLGSTKSGQTYLWNSLNALLGSKGATPAANYPDTSKGYTPWGRSGYGRKGSGGSNFNSTNKPTNTGTTGIKWTPVKARQMASVASSKYTPANIKVKLGNEVKKNKSQNYSDKSF